ncbi:hypothetical protein BT69DRAFT_1285479 [Atractiella rhizophila]|nr:hypothetical protein BT69DRAFT_1285479 [Atractiella rhizophila]
MRGVAVTSHVDCRLRDTSSFPFRSATSNIQPTFDFGALHRLGGGVRDGGVREEVD